MVGFLVLVAFGVAVALIAQSKGRNPVGWFLGGFFFHFIALIVVLIVSDELKHSQNIERERRARRRLREELRQARAQADLAQVRNGVRLDAHDQALGVDTRGEALLATAQVTAAVSATLEERASPGASSSPPPLERRWFYELDAQANGPEPESVVRTRIEMGELPPDVLVWCEGQEDWTRASQVSAFQGLVG